MEFQLQNNLSQIKNLWRMSPLAYAKAAKTPTRFLHSLDDLRCPHEQEEQMYRALKRSGVDSDLILYPKSSHGLSRQGLPNLC